MVIKVKYYDDMGHLMHLIHNSDQFDNHTLTKLNKIIDSRITPVVHDQYMELYYISDNNLTTRHYKKKFNWEALNIKLGEIVWVITY